ncbi:MAG: hypothetical protein ACFB9N_13450 [Geitlerinemataceae cyanobacterium]
MASKLRKHHRAAGRLDAIDARGLLGGRGGRGDRSVLGCGQSYRAAAPFDA